ncbi:hypothetical protein YB2330_003476 [Saitoella coloradoensis]
MTKDDYWIFGYGSLIWKPPPHTDKRVTGFVRGYVRRFWQSSIDHRGTPEYPGRVVTLIPYDEWKEMKDIHESYEDELVWGVAYHIRPENVEEVKEHLGIREQNGYSVHHLPIYEHPSSTSPIVARATTYIGTTSNEAFVGPPPHNDQDELARRILKCKGPSGQNREYLYNMAEALRELSPETRDVHVFDLEERAKRLEKEEGLELAKEEKREMKQDTEEEIENLPPLKN